MLENAYKSIATCTDRAEVSLLMPFVLSITIKGANFIRSAYSSMTGCVVTQAIRPALQNLDYF